MHLNDNCFVAFNNVFPGNGPCWILYNFHVQREYPTLTLVPYLKTRYPNDIFFSILECDREKDIELS